MRISDWSSDVCSSDLFGVGRARRAHVTCELHIAAHRQHGHLPARAAPVAPADQLPPKADGEHVSPHAHGAPRQLMTKLVNENEQADTPPKAGTRQTKSTLSHPNPQRFPPISAAA